MRPSSAWKGGSSRRLRSCAYQPIQGTTLFRDPAGGPGPGTRCPSRQRLISGSTRHSERTRCLRSGAQGAAWPPTASPSPESCRSRRRRLDSTSSRSARQAVAFGCSVQTELPACGALLRAPSMESQVVRTRFCRACPSPTRYRRWPCPRAGQGCVNAASTPFWRSAHRVIPAGASPPGDPRSPPRPPEARRWSSRHRSRRPPGDRRQRRRQTKPDRPGASQPARRRRVRRLR